MVQKGLDLQQKVRIPSFSIFTFFERFYSKGRKIKYEEVVTKK